MAIFNRGLSHCVLLGAIAFSFQGHVIINKRMLKVMRYNLFIRRRFRRSRGRRLGSRSEFGFIDALFDRQHRLEVESDERQPMRLPDPGLPVVRKTLVPEKDLEVLHATTEDGE